MNRRHHKYMYLYTCRYLYNARWKADVPWGIVSKEGAVVIQVGTLLSSSSQWQRTPTMTRRFLRPDNLPSMAHLPWSIIHSAGWHFSSFGNPAALREKLVSYGDSPFAHDFYLEEGRLERLQFFGLPYFYLRAMSSLEDSPFHRVSYAEEDNEEDCRSFPSLPRALEELGSNSSVHRLFFPPLSSASSSSSSYTEQQTIHDPTWAQQDILNAQLLFGPGGMVIPGMASSSSSSSARTFHYDCSKDWLKMVKGFCPSNNDGSSASSSICVQNLSQYLRSICEGEESSSSSGSVQVYTNDHVLVGLWLPTTVLLGEEDSRRNKTNDIRDEGTVQCILKVPVEVLAIDDMQKKLDRLMGLATQTCLDLKATPDGQECIQVMYKGLLVYLNLGPADGQQGVEADNIGKHGHSFDHHVMDRTSSAL